MGRESFRGRLANGFRAIKYIAFILSTKKREGGGFENRLRDVPTTVRPAMEEAHQVREPEFLLRFVHEEVRRGAREVLRQTVFYLRPHGSTLKRRRKCPTDFSALNVSGDSFPLT